jgi:hypothetical protein
MTRLIAKFIVELIWLPFELTAGFVSLIAGSFRK